MYNTPAKISENLLRNGDTNNLMKIQDYLKQHYLLCDGAFGTYYASRFHTEEMPELANLTYPDRVRSIHSEYIQAGARLIRTNTFACNTSLLHKDFDQVEENIDAAITLARESAKMQELFIAGDIGPIPADASHTPDDIQQEYVRLAQAFLSRGIEILHFETFSDIDPLLPAIEACHNAGAFISISFCVNQFGYSLAGLSARHLLDDAARLPVDAIGLNCGVGPGHMLKLLQEMTFPTGKYLLSLSNAGYPVMTRNRLEYGNTPSYFAHRLCDAAGLGIDIIGGCCGTTPEFIRQTALLMKELPKKLHPADRIEQPADKPLAVKGFLYDESGARKKKKLIAVELAPPFDANDEKLLESAHALIGTGVDVLTFPDSPSGRTRVDSVLMADKVHKETGLPVMPHICCRDKNTVAMRSLLMGAKINDIHNLLIITGDPLPTMVRQTVKAVFNFDSVGLMKIAQEMNEEILQNNPFSYGGAINQGRLNLSVEIDRVRKKMAAGASFFLTQPIFCEEDAKRVRQIKEETGACILCGIMPLISRKNALFMKNEISGVNIPEEVLDRYPENGSRKEGEAVGVSIAKDILKLTEDFADGYYFSFPFNRTYLLTEILS